MSSIELLRSNDVVKKILEREKYNWGGNHILRKREEHQNYEENDDHNILRGQTFKDKLVT